MAENNEEETTVLEMQSELLHPSLDPSPPVLEPIMETSLPSFLTNLNGYHDPRQSDAA